MTPLLPLLLFLVVCVLLWLCNKNASLLFLVLEIIVTALVLIGAVGLPLVVR